MLPPLSLVLLTALAPHSMAPRAGHGSDPTDGAHGALRADEGTPADEEPEVDVEGTVVIATLDRRDEMNDPYAGSQLEAEGIRRGGYRTTPRVLERTPGVLVQETAHGQGSPYIRGFTGFRNVFLIDGIRLNHSAFRDGPNQYWNTVDPFSIASLEVVRGSSSVAHGSDAIGGVVKATGRRPDAYGAGRPTVEVHHRYASAERSNIVHADASVADGDELGVRVGVTGKRFGDLRGGEEVGTQEYTGYDEWDADIALELFLDDSWEAVLAYSQVHQSDVPRTHRTVFAESFEGTSVGSDLRRDLDQERHLAYLQLRGRDLDGPLDEANFSFSFQEHSEARRRTRGNGSMDTQGFEVNTLGFFANAAIDGRLGRLRFGTDFYHDTVDSFSSRNAIQGPVADDANYDLFGVFVEDEIPLGPRVELLLGARYQYASLRAGSVQDPTSGNPISIRDEWDAVVGSARFVARVIEDVLHLFGGVSQGFRAPNLSDVTRLDSARTNEFEIASPGLDPERSTSFELGVRTRGAGHSSELAVFYTELEDAIIRHPTGNTNGLGEAEVVKDNVGDGFVFGVELQGNVDLGGGWEVGGAGTYMQGKLDTFPTSAPVVKREPIDRLMPLTLMASLGWADDANERWFELAARWADDADRLSTRDRADTSRIPPGGTPSYLVVDLRGGIELTPWAELTLGLENVMNEDYRVHGSGQNSAGRSLVLGLTVRR